MTGIGIGIAPHEIFQTMSVDPPSFRFNIVEQVFQEYMAKRIGQGPFAAAPIVQGHWDGSGVPDVLSFPRGNLIGNQTQLEYANFDPYQGSAVFWITPEWDGDDGILHFLHGGDSDPINIYKRADDLLIIRYETTVLVSTNVAAWTAGATYCVVMRWDSLNTLDGTNYGCASINDAHNFEGTVSWIAVIPPATQYIGSYGGATNAADSILEGLTIYRRPLYDGTYGIRPQNGNQYSADEINAIWNAGAGRDPTLITGSEDVVFCLPTDSQTEILATGIGEAWSWPWEDNLPDVWGAWDGGLPGTDYAVEFNGTTTFITCGSDVDIDDIQDDAFTAEAWLRMDAYGAVSSFIFSKVGWNFLYTDTELIADVDCATTDALSIISASNIPDDGKWHHYMMFFDDAGDRKIYFAVDGVWAAAYDTQDAGVGAIVTDAAEDLIIGNRAAADRAINGAIAWAAISNNDRHTVGTDFIPPRAFPADDVNYLASWPMDEGTAAPIDNIGNQGGAGSGAANRDGALVNGAWSSIWEQVAIPVIPQSVEFDGSTTDLNCGSGASIDDLHDAEFTAEAWVRADGWGNGSVGIIFIKGDADEGWQFIIQSGVGLRGFIPCATTPADSRIPFTPDGRWHHVLMMWDDSGAAWGARTIRLFIDGIEPAYDLQDAGVGAIVTDAGWDLYIGSNGTNQNWDGGIGACRLSSVNRYTADFVPASRTDVSSVWTLPDATTELQLEMTDGVGATVTDTSANGYDGTLAAVYVWRNTPDMEIDEPGAAIYGPKGYNIGADAALKGMYIEQTVVAETDYVVFPILSIGESGRARPRIRIRDMSNAADVKIFNGPMLYGTHQGGNGSPDLIPTNPRWIADALIDGAVYNITDGSAAPISDNNEDILTAGIGGGTDNDWDNDDVFVIRMPRGYCERPWQESFCFQVPAQCTLIRIYIENINTEGVMQIHQLQVLPNLLVNGDHENLTGGNPDIITGWTNVLLDAGDTESSAGSAGFIHSGAEALEWNAGAIAGEYIERQLTLATYKFFAFGGWYYGDGTTALRQITSDALLQYSDTLNTQTAPLDAMWATLMSVNRSVVANPTIIINPNSSTPGGDRFSDDIYVIEMDDVSLTITPANQANSLEAGGLRIDGRDISDQPVVGLRANAGWISFNARPRHEIGEVADFGQPVEYLFDCLENANNYIRAWRAGNSINLEFNANGAGALAAPWNATGLWDENVDREIWVQYGAFGAWLFVDGVIRIIIPVLCLFATDFTADIHWGHDWNGELQFDGVIS